MVSTLPPVAENRRPTQLSPSQSPPPSPAPTIQGGQEEIFSYLLYTVRGSTPEETLAVFRQLFINPGDSSSEAAGGLYPILIANDEVEFRNTLKRSCYILINNWEIHRYFEAIQSLVMVFQEAGIRRETYSPTLKRLRLWLQNFVNSDDYAELKLYAARFTEQHTPTDWTGRYTPYLLVEQYTNTENSKEQREAARIRASRLKEKFKFDLAMYTAHSQAASVSPDALKNPTGLGDSALRLVKLIVAKRGKFSYHNLARLFLKQTEELTYRAFKWGFVEYLLYSSPASPQVGKSLRQQLTQRLDTLYEECDDSLVDDALRLRTCNRIIDYLTTEDKETPSTLFTVLLSQGTSLFLAILLLKVVLVSRHAHPYLEARIAALIRYYNQFPEEDCAWVINFLEVFQVTFAIYAENVEYNLVNPRSPQGMAVLSADALEACRVFSQLTGYTPEPPSS